MRILLTGDSITDMGRSRERDLAYNSYGMGYPIFIQGALGTEYPGEHQVYNRGISGNRSVDLYARIKCDCWNLQPDVISILIGVNDVWHEVGSKNGVELNRFERVLRMFLEDTKKQLPDVKFILMEPFVLHGAATEEHFEEFCAVYDYAATVKRLAKEYGCAFVPLQEKLSALAKEHGAETYLYDGVHPAVAGAKTIADEWMKVFKEEFIKS